MHTKTINIKYNRLWAIIFACSPLILALILGACSAGKATYSSQDIQPVHVFFVHNTLLQSFVPTTNYLREVCSLLCFSLPSQAVSSEFYSFASRSFLSNSSISSGGSNSMGT